MADSTFAFGGQTAGAGKSLWSGEQDTIKGFGDAVAYVSSILTDELYILGGSKPALERQQDRGENMLRAAEILLNPAVVAQLSKAYREELARAYDSGDAERIGRVQGQGMMSSSCERLTCGPIWVSLSQGRLTLTLLKAVAT